MSSDRPDDLQEPMALLDLSSAPDKAQIDGGEPDRNAFDLRLAGLGAAGSQTGAVRLEKVAQVRAALSAGNYSVPAEAVAIKMLDAMLALEQKRVLEDRRKRARVGHRSLLRGRARRGTS